MTSLVWLAVLAGIVVALLVAWRFLGTSSHLVPADEQIEPDALASILEQAGIDLTTTKVPDPEILRPHIRADDEILGAIEAKHGNKRALLVALPDRLVLGDATLRRMGAEVRSIPFSAVEEFEQSYDMGGEFTIATSSHEFLLTHIPRSKTRDFAELIRQHLPDDAA